MRERSENRRGTSPRDRLRSPASADLLANELGGESPTKSGRVKFGAGENNDRKTATRTEGLFVVTSGNQYLTVGKKRGAIVTARGIHESRQCIGISGEAIQEGLSGR